MEGKFAPHPDQDVRGMTDCVQGHAECGQLECADFRHSGAGPRILLTERGVSDRFVFRPSFFRTRSFLVEKFSTRFKVKAILIGIGVIILLAFYSYFIPDTVRTKITDAQMAKVDGRFMIATEYRPFVNYDAKYRFKFNSGTIQNEAIKLKGREVTIRKYGWRIPLFSRYENVVSIKEVK